MTTVETAIYQFDELSGAAKEKARDWYRGDGFDYDWWDSVYTDAKAVGALMGIDITNIYFSGFSAQDDGSCFEGCYAYKPRAVADIENYMPGDAELPRIAQRLQTLQRHHFYRLTADIAHHGYYYHALCTDIEVGNSAGYGVPGAAENELAKILRDFMRWIYRALEGEWDYLNSNDVVDAGLRANGYTFTIDGKRF